ncbi:hypothetical protein DFH08DRAFT_758006 [Mycena albidolilacea]|uniref:BTB domain-containing protein n=1 Tax=Mycena albidolilacea TaxID=1033008 RepID=A0AAD6Z5H5_9AGAR|nr:hypothetical protein DFH08DRAFT_758006 [Mycena albidolilacea]
MEGAQIPNCQSDGCTLIVDIFLRSSDGVLHAAHSKNLEMYGEGFPPSALVSVSRGGDTAQPEVVQMTEQSDIIELLLKYMHLQRQPDLSRHKFDTLAGLAEAAEKYLVYSAMDVCRIRMGLYVQDHPARVLAYAIKHDYPELRDVAVPLTLTMPLSTMKALLQDAPHGFIAWAQYREGFIEAMHSSLVPGTVVLHKGGVQSCGVWEDFHCAILRRIDLDSIRDFSRLIGEHKHQLDGCHHCTVRAENWAKSVAHRVSKLPLFSYFL